MGDHKPGPEPYHPSYEAPTTPFQRVVMPADETVAIPRPPSPGLYRPPPTPKRGLGDIPMKTAYLLGAIVVTVIAVVLVFTLFSGDQPNKAAGIEQQSAQAPAGPTPTAATLPPVPESLPLAVLPGTPSKVTGTVKDAKTGIVYPRLGKPWTAKSFGPFAFAQRVGKVATPHTMIASAFLPGDKPAAGTSHRDLAARAARWALRTQHPKGATLTWTASQKLVSGEGWLLGFEVTYGEKTSQALVAVLDVGKTKPAMLLVTIPDGGKAPAADINTLVKGLRTR